MLGRLSFLGVLLAALSVQAATLSKDGKAAAAIVLAADAMPAEQTAAKELADYLSKATGGQFPISDEASATRAESTLHVGPTAFAAKLGLDATRLGPEEWLMRTVGKDLILIGGRTRGTLYAVHRFLEDVVGVHWWSPWEESVPRKPSLAVDALDRRGKPVLAYRDIYMLYGNDGGRFAARNRLNRDGDARIAKDYGGCRDYGPPYHVHTFNMYVPPDKFLKERPEWFSLIKGERVGDHAQLCLTNQALRDFFVAKLKAYIRTARENAEKEGLPAPDVFEISQNDWAGMCQCDPCQKIAKAEESEAGPLCDFVNHIADAIKPEHPEVLVGTLAYMMTQKAPKTIKPRDNVIIRLCDTHSNFTRSITDAENAAFREHLTSWSKIAKNLRIWDYAVTYAPYYGLPLPTVHTYPLDYQFYAEHNVQGVFTEHEYPILADLRDFKLWMMMKMLEDPYRDYAALVQTFTDGCYGPAGAPIREYLSKLEAPSAAKVSFLSMGASPRQYRYLDLEFIQQAQALFDRAEKAVAADADAEASGLTARKPYVALPEKFRSLPPGSVFDYTADTSRNWRDIVKVVPDKDAESGITNRLEFPTAIDPDKQPLEKYKLPMPWGLYDQLNKKAAGRAVINPEDVPGYHWHKMSAFTIGPSYYLYFFWSWIIQVDIDDVADPARPDQKFEVWARIKFEGPAFPHGQPAAKNAICVERVVLVRAQEMASRIQPSRDGLQFLWRPYRVQPACRGLSAISPRQGIQVLGAVQGLQAR